MKLYNFIFILIIILLFFILKGCINIPIESKEKRTDYPYIENGILYTQTRTVPIRFITNVELVNDNIRYIIITFKYDKYNGGMTTMNYYDFKKIEIELLGATYEQKLDEATKKK